MIPGFRKCIFLITARLARLKWRFLTGFCLMSLPSAIAIIAEFQKKKTMLCSRIFIKRSKISENKRFIKRIADLTIEKKLSVVAASGLSSRVGSNIPRIYNLNNSLADSAKKVLLLYREVANYPESFEIEKNMIEVFIAKNNSGSLGKALLLFKPEFGRIENKTQTLK